MSNITISLSEVKPHQEKKIAIAEAGLVITPLYPVVREFAWCSTDQEYGAYTRCACEDRSGKPEACCGGVGKHPIHSIHDPEGLARTPDDVLRLWPIWPRGYERCGIAAVCGPSNIIVVEADARHGGLESLARLIRDFALPETWMDDRGGKSPHLYFAMSPCWEKVRPALPRTIRLPDYAGVEVLSGSHLINLGDSDHEDGIRREWLPGREAWNPASAIWPLPEAFIQYVDRVVPIGDGGSRRSMSLPISRSPGGAAASGSSTGGDEDDGLAAIKRAARQVARAEDREAELKKLLASGEFPRIEAYRNDTLYRTACSLHYYGIDPDVITETIELINAEACRVPYPSDGVQTLLDSAAKGDYGPVVTEADVTAIIENARRQQSWPQPISGIEKTKHPPLLHGTPRPQGGDGASHSHDGYCTCFYRKTVKNKRTGRPGVGWFSWGRCEWCIEQRRLEMYLDAEAGVKKSIAAGVTEFYISVPFVSKSIVFRKKTRIGTETILSTNWWGRVPGESFPREFCADRAASQAMLNELIRKAGIVAAIDGDNLVRKIRDDGGGTATVHLPDDRRVVFSDRPLTGIASRKTDAAGVLVAIKATLAEAEPRGQGRPMMTLGGTWKPPEKEEEKNREPVLEIGGRCTWTLQEIEQLCRELNVGIIRRHARGKMKYWIEFDAPDQQTEDELMRRLSGPSPYEESEQGEGTESFGWSKRFWKGINDALAEAETIGDG